MTERRLRVGLATVPPLSRRGLLAAALTSLAVPRALAEGSFESFLDTIRAEAAGAGISRGVIAASLNIAEPNARVLSLNNRQPEFTLTWAQYEARVLPESRLRQAVSVYSARTDLFDRVRRQFLVDPGVIIGIWGLESDFGRKQGDFNVFDSLATLAFASRRHGFFRGELLNALTISDRRGVAPGDMLGSWAGAMGQPQFMPSAYLRFACELDGNLGADIWKNEADVMSSVANYLKKSGWRLGEPWGQRVLLPEGLVSGTVDLGRRSLAKWEASGVRRVDGRRFSRGDVIGRLVLPSGRSGDAFLVYANFDAIRRYNPSDFYALAVGLLGDQVA